MFKRFFLLLLVFTMTPTVAQNQRRPLTPLSEQKIEADQFLGFDVLGNLYYLKNKVLFKKNETQTWQYKNLVFGKITRVDFLNPLKILLFYEDFNTVIMLDNQLNEIQKINFSDNSAPLMIGAIGIASQNRLWIYDRLSQQIGLFDYLKNTFKTITPSFQSAIKHYESNFNSFQWIDEKNNWYTCDIFGKVSPIGTVPDFEQIQFIDNEMVLFSKEGKLYLQHIQNQKCYPIVTDDKSFESFYYKDQILAIFTASEIKNYKIIIP